MRRVQFACYYLPPAPGRRKPHASSWKMTPEEAAQRGALEIVPGSIEYRDVPETEEERQRAQTFYQGAGRDGAEPPKR